MECYVAMLINEVNTADLFQALTQHVMVVFGDEFSNMYHLRINMFQIITKGGSWCTIMVKPYKHYFCDLYNLLFVIWDNDLNGLERKWLDFLITWRRFTSYLRSFFSSTTNLISCLTTRRKVRKKVTISRGFGWNHCEALPFPIIWPTEITWCKS